MGKLSAEQQDLPSPSPTPTPLGESASAISLQSTATPPITRYFDDDPAEFDADDLPPLYNDLDHDGHNVQPSNPLLPPGVLGPDLECFRRDAQTDTVYYLDRRLDTDPEFLQSQLTRLSHLPPRPFAHIHGQHTERVQRDGKTENKTIVDFDIQIELTHLLYEDIRTRSSLHELHTVGNFEKVKRGSILAERAPGFGGNGVAEMGTPSFEDWCLRYCASNAGLKHFLLERRIVGWDFAMLRQKLESLIRSTNYRGKLTINFPVHGAHVHVYNKCRSNEWRLTQWIAMIFVFTLMFVIAWPVLFFRTRHWETVYVQWHMSVVQDGAKHYISMSEDRWYNLWARAISKAALQRRQGELTQTDLENLENGPDEVPEGLGGLVHAGVEAMGVVNRSFGWGGDR